MNIRLAWISAIAAAGIATAFAGTAQAQGAYPDKVIKMIVPAPPGGQTDVLARLLAQKMQQGLGQSVIIDNRPGAGGALGARVLAAAEPDGYTLFFGNTSTLAVIPAVAKNPGYSPAKNFAPVASVSESYMILVVHPDFPAKTVAEFVAYAKANPGKLNFGHAGFGNVTHLTGEMFRSLSKIDFLGVPHRGGAESITGLLGRQVDFLFESPVVLLPLIRDGKLRALGVTSATSQAGIPTMVEAGVPGFVATLLTGIVAPAGTPPAIVTKLNGVINDTLKTADVRDLLAKFGSQPRIGTPQEFAAFLAGETRKWSEIAKAANVSID
ncbi:MAG: Bug family tripartite tricarboxylate transporter substrate binding protein [Xanthobacteraceae bacterium]